MRHVVCWESWLLSSSPPHPPRSPDLGNRWRVSVFYCTGGVRRTTNGVLLVQSRLLCRNLYDFLVLINLQILKNFLINSARCSHHGLYVMSHLKIHDTKYTVRLRREKCSTDQLHYLMRMSQLWSSWSSVLCVFKKIRKMVFKQCHGWWTILLHLQLKEIPVILRSPWNCWCN